MSSEHQQALASLNQLFERWKAEHRELETHVLKLNQWVTGDEQNPATQFEEATKLFRQLQEHLEEHFTGENDIGELLARARGASTDEIEATRRQASKDHALLHQRLQTLIDSLAARNDDVDQWAAIVYDFGLFIDLLEQHEDLEAENVRRLIPCT